MTRMLAIVAGMAIVAGSLATTTATGAEPLKCIFRVATLVADHDGQVLQGTSKPDVMSANGFQDVTLDGLGGDDVLCAEADGTSTSNETTLDGGSGNDILIGSHGNTTLLGGDGNDELTAAGGNDDLQGGPGNDSLFAGGGTDAAAGDSGVDTILFDSSQVDGVRRGVHIDARDGVETDAVGGATTFSGLEKYRGTGEHDTFIGSDRAETYDSQMATPTADDPYPGGDIQMGGGDDTAYVHYAHLDLGPGNDHALVWSGGWVAGGPGNDTVVTDWDYNCACGDGVTRAWLGSGNDVFVGRNGLDEGGEPFASPAYFDVAGQSGHDTVDLKRIWPHIRADLGTGHATWETGDLDMTSIATFRGGIQGDHIVGTSGRDDISGRGGNDTILGRGGNDRLHGDLGRDHLVGGPGHDTAWGGPRNDVCHTEVRHHC